MRIVAVGHGLPAAMLRVVAGEMRSPEAGEVAVEVRAAGINPKDLKLYANEDYARMRDRDTPFPLALGLEASGVVTAVGPNATGPLGPIAVGDEVIAFRIEGAYASTITVAASAIIPKPTRLNWVQAASMMLPATTAFHCIAATRVRRGETVLVHGAAGAVGRFVVQLALIAGANVVGTVSSKDAELLLSLGATPVVRGEELAVRIRSAAPNGIVSAIDTVGTDEVIDATLAVVHNRQRIATIVNLARAQRDGFQALGGEAGNHGAIGIRDNARYVIAALAQAGALNVHVDQCFPLAQVVTAHELALQGGAGRLVLTAD